MRPPEEGTTRAAAGPGSSLRRIKLIHTVVWAFFAACVLVIPVLAWHGELGRAALFIAIVAVEVLVLALNRWTCPLTPLAARHTDDRRDNFDIYLPEWLARHNKRIFGWLYVAGIVVTLVRWLRGG